MMHPETRNQELMFDGLVLTGNKGIAYDNICRGTNSGKDFYLLWRDPKKTLNQLKYYWGIVLEDIADQTGYWPDEIHDFNKKLFGIKSTYFIGNEAAELIKGLSKMGKKRAAEFITRVIEHWTSKGIIIREADRLTGEEIVTAIMTDEQD